MERLNRVSEVSRKRAQVRGWVWVLLGAFALWTMGFRCGPMVQDCLTESDCPRQQRCSLYRCLSYQKPSEGPRDELVTPDSREGAVSERLSGGERDGGEPMDGGEGKKEWLPEPECQEGQTQECYSGVVGTAGVGVCKKGSRRCRQGRWSGCEGEVSPEPPTCNGKDNNCDGSVDLCALNDWCVDGKKCEGSLICHDFRCHHACDPRKGKENNVDCVSDAICFGRSATEGVCKQRCFAVKSVCPGGSQCREGIPGYSMGLCVPNAPPRQGPRKLGQSCSDVDSARYCDGSQALVCVSVGSGMECRQGCELWGRPCEVGKRCVESALSFLGGFCE